MMRAPTVAVMVALVATAGWALGPDWSGPLRFAGIIGGILLIAGGVLFGVRAVADLGTALTPLPRPGDQAELVETGAYALARHPIYGGLILAAFGWAIVEASIVAVTLAAVLAAFFRLEVGSRRSLAGDAVSWLPCLSSKNAAVHSLDPSLVRMSWSIESREANGLVDSARPPR